MIVFLLTAKIALAVLMRKTDAKHAIGKGNHHYYIIFITINNNDYEKYFHVSLCSLLAKLIPITEPPLRLYTLDTTSTALYGRARWMRKRPSDEAELGKKSKSLNPKPNPKPLNP